MTESDLPRDEAFDVPEGLDSLAMNYAFESANVCRVVALAPLFGPDPQASLDLIPELRTLGFSGRLIDRPSAWQDTDTDWYVTTDGGSDEERLERWTRLNESPSRSAARAFALTLLISPLDRESAAAAAVLWRQFEEDDPTAPLPREWRVELYRERWWGRQADRLFADLWSWIDFRDPDPDDTPSLDLEAWRYLVRSLPRLLPWPAVVQLAILVRWRLELARRSSDPIQRSFAAAVLPLYGRGDVESESQPSVGASPGSVSTMIHGTWGWKGSWWRPRGDFHDFILNSYRPNLYARGARFSWSGAYSDRQRRLAGRDFCEWAADISPGGIQSLFAHSYGGEIAARAWLARTPIDQLVLLSTPVNGILRAAASAGAPIIDVRLPFDPVLALARNIRQRLPAAANVTTVVLHGWRLDHAATHNPTVWLSESVAARASL